MHVIASAVNGKGDVAGIVTEPGNPPCSYVAHLSDGVQPATETWCFTGVSVNDMDETGRVVGMVSASGPGFLLSDGLVVELLGPDDTQDTRTFAIAETGVIVGAARRGSYPSPAYWTVSHPEVTYLPGEWGRTGYGVDVNNEGLILTRTGLHGLDTPRLYDLGSESAIDLVGPLPTEAFVMALNNEGTVVGRDPTRDDLAFLLSPARVMDAVEDVDGEWSIEELVDIDDTGNLLAKARLEGGPVRPVILRPAVGGV